MEECPIGLNCSNYEQEKDLFGYEICSNNSRCWDNTTPWPLPFRRAYGVLEVVVQINTGTSALPLQYYEGIKESGWQESLMLPFRYRLWDEEWVPYTQRFENFISQGLPFPVLIVDFFYQDQDTMEYLLKYSDIQLTQLRECGWEMAVSVDGSDEF